MYWKLLIEPDLLSFLKPYFEQSVRYVATTARRE